MKRIEESKIFKNLWLTLVYIRESEALLIAVSTVGPSHDPQTNNDHINLLRYDYTMLLTIKASLKKLVKGDGDVVKWIPHSILFSLWQRQLPIVLSGEFDINNIFAATVSEDVLKVNHSKQIIISSMII